LVQSSPAIVTSSSISWYRSVTGSLLRNGSFNGDRVESFREHAKKIFTKAFGSLIVRQVVHPGRQVQSFINGNTVSASDVPFGRRLSRKPAISPFSFLGCLGSFSRRLFSVYLIFVRFFLLNLLVRGATCGLGVLRCILGAQMCVCSTVALDRG
jgi:hypothetical protein